MSGDLAKQIALAAAVVALCAGAFFACFERREVEEWRGESPEARRNRYLAVGRLLERMGHEVEAHGELTQLAELPPPPATAIVPMERSAFGEARSRALLDWVARGGHLVVATYTVWAAPEKPVPGGPSEVIVSGKPDLLLDRFGLRQRQAAPARPHKVRVRNPRGRGGAGEAEPDAPPSLPAPAPHWDDGSTETAIAELPDGGRALEVEFNDSFWWDDPRGVATWRVAGARGAHLLELPHGAGRISALTSDEPLANGWLESADHAEFVVRWLRAGGAERAPVWIFYEAEWPSWFALLRRHAAPALAGGATLLALWLWRSLFRFGPALPAPAPARRRWLEHLEAAGRFHWRQDRGRALLDGLRAQALAELALARPSWARLPERERMERVAQASGLPLEQVAEALLGGARSPRAFAAAVRTLERIRAAI